MAKETDIPKGERMVRIYAHLVRNKSRKYSVHDILAYLDQTDNVSLRNVQRDMKELSEMDGACVSVEIINGKKYYFIEPDMRRKLSLPIQRNGLLAFFLLKRLQPFFPSKTATFEELTEAVIDRVSKTDYDLFEDLDEKLEETTFLLGEQSALALDGAMFNDLLTSLVKHRMLKILYAGAAYEKPKEKTVCPVKLILFKGELYFVCMSEADPKWDFYVKLCRILKAELTDAVFIPDKKRIERIQKRLVSSFGIYDGAEPAPKKIVIRFPSDKYYEQIFNERKYHHSQKLSKDKAGNNILTMQVPVGLDLVNWVLAWPDAVVVEPEELRKEMRNVGKSLETKYGK
jgi:Predicted transcriptional regulator